MSESTCYRDIEHQILTAVVSMYSARILSWLRLGSSKRTKLKRPFKGTLQEALLAMVIVRKKLKDEALLETLESFNLRAKEVEKLLGSWSKYQVDTSLVRVVEGIY